MVLATVPNNLLRSMPFVALATGFLAGVLAEVLGPGLLAMFDGFLGAGFVAI
jgi:hypothetical protein